MLTNIILGVLGLFTLAFTFVFVKDLINANKTGALKEGSFAKAGGAGFVVNFFDTLGIGAFAPLTALLKGFKITNDKLIPGTLNVACTIPVILEAFIFMNSIEVDSTTLIGMLAAAILGAVVGAGFVSKLDEKKIQLVMAIALLAVAIIMLLSQLNLMPVGGDAIGLTGIYLVIAIVINFILGALMMAGIGLYAPCMALVYALGMSPKVAFPIMMGSCAFLMPAGSMKFIKEGTYDRKASLAITIFGSIGVFIAAYLVKSLPLEVLKKLVLVVVVYTSFTMFRSFSKKKAA